MNSIFKTAIVLCCCILVLTPAANVRAAQFADTEAHWARDYIEVLWQRGGVTGMEDGLFHPDEAVTNAQFVTMLIRTRYGEMNSADGSWYSAYMDSAFENGIITDMETDYPNEPISRQSTARITHEMLLAAYNESDDDNWMAAEALADLYECSSCVMHVAQLYVKGIMTGYGDGLFHYSDTLTRAEAVTIIMRLSDSSLRVPPPKTEDSEMLITARQAFEMMRGGAVLVDVRPADEYTAGHLQGSISIPMEIILHGPEAAFAGFEHDSTIIVYCRRGTNSHRAAAILIGAGYTKVYNLGGIENGEYELVTE